MVYTSSATLNFARSVQTTVHSRRKRVSNMPMLCVVTHLECQLFDDHFQMGYSIYTNITEQNYILAFQVCDFPNTSNAEQWSIRHSFPSVMYLYSSNLLVQTNYLPDWACWLVIQQQVAPKQMLDYQMKTQAVAETAHTSLHGKMM